MPQGHVDERFQWLLAERVGVLVVDGLTWRQADVLCRTLGIRSTPSAVPLATSAIGGYDGTHCLSFYKVEVTGKTDFGWPADSAEPLTVGAA